MMILYICLVLGISLELIVTSFLVSFLIHVLNEIFDIYPFYIFTRVLLKFKKKQTNNYPSGIWMAQLVKRPTLVQVMISWSMSLNPTSGSVLTALSQDSASDSVSLFLCPSPACALSLSISQK